MGGRESRTVAALDRLTGGLLLAASAAGAGFALSLFNAKGELARLSAELVQGLGQRLRGLDRFSRTERLAAAHSVVALTAYFEVLAGADLPFDARELELTGSEQVALVQGAPPGSNRLKALAAGLLRADVPMPAPQYPYEATVETMRGFYEHLSDDLSRFVAGLAVYEQLDETNRRRFTETLSGELPGRAVTRYEELFRQLAAEFPEVAFWANLVDHQATRAEVRRLSGGLEGLERMLADIASGRVADERRSGLSRAYRAALHRPVLTLGEVPEGLCLPTLGEAYVNPEFRVAEAVAAERLAEESWWNEQPVRGDLEGFLAGHLTAPQAVAAPLLLLGQPGSGKSVLTQVLAARLPADEFLVVRVVLREVAADADLQTQIEDAVRSATGENLAWPNLARSTGGALLVVLLDGFDELLQATGVSQTDYLRRVAAFQAREADQGRPVAVVVTSRTAVADRAQPVPGMVALRLEPFGDAHISHWLGIWNDANAAAFVARGLLPLTPQTALAHADLASQPLLLLMLALYDSDANALQRSDAALRKAELYERLLTRFAEREIGKTGASLPAAEFADAVERELLRLSVVAFAMFSRGRQWVSETELDSDLNALLDPVDSQAAPAGLRARLTAAQVVVGRFFFVYEAQAIRDNAQLKTYEFLHATFGEYLTARLITRELGDLVDAAQFAASRSRPAPADDAFLHALLSFMPLTMRGTVVSFTAEHLQALPESRRDLLSTVLLELFRDSLGPRHDTRYADYAPLALPVPARYAAYSANLVILAVLTSGEVAGAKLFPASSYPVEDWRKLALLWRSQLPREGWDGLIDAVTLDRIWAGDQRNIILRLGETAEQPAWAPDPLWDLNIGPGHEHRARGPDSSSIYEYLDNGRLRNQARFICDAGDDAFVHALQPFARDLGSAVTAFHSYGPEGDRAVSAANALITLWLTSGYGSTPDELAVAYNTCLKILAFGFSPSDTDTRERFRILVLRQLATDQHRVSRAMLESALVKMQDVAEEKWATEGAALLRLAREIIPELIAASPHESPRNPYNPGNEGQ
jgi:hypothetical protein